MTEQQIQSIRIKQLESEGYYVIKTVFDIYKFNSIYLKK
jgi:hypothetical protein